MSGLRVLSVGNMYPPHSLGGYEIAWRSATEQMRENGHDVRILTTGYRRPGVAEEADAGTHRELRWYWDDHRFPRLSIRERIGLERHNAAVLDRHLAEHRPDVVAWWAMGGMSMSLLERVRRSGPPAVGIVCDEWPVYGPAVDGWIRLARRAPGLAERLTGIPGSLGLEHAARWMFLSRTLLESFRAKGLEFEGEVHGRGIEREVFRREPPRDWSGRLAYVGRIDPRKGIPGVIDALRLLPDAKLTIDGGGDDRHLAELRARAQELGVEERVSFSASRREDLRSVYAASDAVVFPVTWNEPWGLVPLEAMSVGRPVVATGRGGSGEYLEDGVNCLLYDPDGGPGELAAAVGRLASDPALRGALVEAGLETAAAYDVRDWNAAVERTHVEAAGGSG